ncbi:MAG: glycoside hydrolase family 92 protein, partial [Chloroflexi bacterium]|nr:glycoside hydrolase family 92 protein [Chloroflexota bacterium]
DRWPQNNTYTNVMCGSPLTTALVTTWNAGLHHFDLQSVYPGMWKDGTEAPPPGKPYGGEAGIDWLNRIGYVPNDKVDYGAVSQTEEDCIAYSALANLARELGKPADAATMTTRALDFKRLFDPTTGFMRPRNADGSWQAPFDPTQQNGYVEGTAWEYLWLAPQDVSGLIRLIGGDDAFNAKLDQFFQGGHYDPYNEPDLQAPFLYDYSGAPWKSQEQVRKVLASVYHTTPNGIPGNDDCGTMSSWFIFASMGFYPVDPGVPAFEMVNPLWTRVTIHLPSPHPGRTFVVAGGGGAYVNGASLNGKTLPGPWFSEAAMLSGGSLLVRSVAAPDKSWGAAPANRPPSLEQ